MNPNPFGNRQVPHDEVIRRFLQRIKDDSQPTKYLPAPKYDPPAGWRRPSEQLISPQAADELARWFRK